METMEVQKLLSSYEKYLRKENVADNTIKAYSCAVKYFVGTYENISRNNLLRYKGYLITNYKPSTVNARILAINNFLHFLKKDNLKLKTVKVQ